VIVCICKSVSDRSVARAIAQGAGSVEDIARCTGAGTGCGTCRHSLQEALDMASGRRAKPRIVLPLVALTG
jgi:bacterioferritin-associated ferredoxin